MARKSKKKSREDLAFPIVSVPSLVCPVRPTENPDVIKQIIRGAIQGAFCKKSPSEDISYFSDNKKQQQPLVSEEQIQFVIHLIESLEPKNAIEAALASQFAITYIRGLMKSQGTHPLDIKSTLQLFEFGHQVLDTLQKYRTNGAQLINVQYNHNQGQINNINLVEEDLSHPIIEVN